MHQVTERVAWERQRGESTQAFRAFTIFRDAGPTRSYPKVARELAVSLTLIKRWGSKRGWVARAAACDAYVDQHKRAKQLKRLDEMRDRQITHMLLLQQKALEKLTTMPAGDLTADQVKAILIEAGKREAVLRGEPESIVKRNNADADGEKLPEAPAVPQIIIQEVVVTSREEVRAAIADAKEKGIPLLSGD